MKEPIALSRAQERMIRRLGLTPGHVEPIPRFNDGREKYHWKQTVRSLNKKGLLELHKDYALDEVYSKLSRDGLDCAIDLFRATAFSPAEREAFEELRQWRKALKSPPKPAPIPLPVVAPPPPCSGGWRCPVQHAAATRQGIVKARRSGVRIGRPPAVIPEDKVLELRARGTSFRVIARSVGLGSATIHRFFKQRTAH